MKKKHISNNDPRSTRVRRHSGGIHDPRFLDVLLNPGPVNTSLKVKQALMRGDLCHREMEFSELLLRVRRHLLKAFNLEKEYTAIFLTGSGTVALEAALVSFLDPYRKVLILSNGVYGDRMDRIVSVHGFQKVLLKVSFGLPLPLGKINETLLSDPQIETVAMVHHETSTGMLNPVQEIARLEGMRGKKMILDSISALGGESISLKDAHVQVCVGTANKCLQGLPGVSFVLIQKSELERLKLLPTKSLYMDLKGYWEEQESGGVPFTPAIPIFYALDEALEEILHEGVNKRIARYRQYSNRFRRGFEKLGLEYLIPSEYHSNTLTAIKLPDGISYEDLHDRLKEEGFVIYAGQGQLKKEIFRIANMGNLKLKDIDRFLISLGKILYQKGK